MKEIRTFIALLQRNTALTFLLGAFLAWGLEQFFSGLLENAGLAVAFVIAVVALILFQTARELPRHLRNRTPAMLGKLPPVRRGLIFLYSNRPTLEEARQHHRRHIAYLWLIVTPESAQKLAKDPPDLASVTVLEEKVLNAWNPNETDAALLNARDRARDLGVRQPDLICDVTGGTTAMTIGAVAAGLTERLQLQVMAPLEPMEVAL